MNEGIETLPLFPIYKGVAGASLLAEILLQKYEYHMPFYRQIRLITLCRKNFLFCGNHEATENMGVIMSLLATCRNHNVNQRGYLNDIIAGMPYMEKASEGELVEMLPHRWILSHTEAVITYIRNQAKQ